MLRRVDRLTQQANRIEENRLSDRLTLPGNDEFARLAGAFNRMLDRLQAAFDRQRTLLEQQRRFTADASHELKTPLTVIKGNATVLLSDETLKPEQREAIEDMNIATGAMTRLVQDLLLLARSDAGQLGRNGQAISLADVLSRSAQLHRSRHAGIKAHLPPTDMIVMGNEDELVRLFSNLIDNAIRYTPADGTIAIDFKRQEKGVTVSVADTGIGIARQHLARLGERFYRVDSARSRTDGGSGLGLAICREIAKAHGGSLSIDSEPGKGTTVRVTLPV
jgi:signal transduction histidine kinase